MSELGMAMPTEAEWAAFVAIDWADRKNFWRLQVAGSEQSEAGELENTPEAVEVWAASLQQRFGGRPIAVCLEQSRGGLVYMLPSTRTWFCFPFTPLPRRGTGKRSRLPVPRLIRAIRPRCWICCGAIGNVCGRWSQTR